MGLTTCLLISLYIHNEWSYDRFHDKADRIVRVVFGGKLSGGEIKEANVMPPVAQAFLDEFPEVEESTRMRHGGRPFFEVNGKRFHEEGVAFVDSNFFNVFSFRLLQGNAQHMLKEPYMAVISEEVAQKFFGTDDAIGKEITIKDDDRPLKVTGVFENLPQNSHFHFDIFVSMSSFQGADSNSWMESGYYTYLVLQPDYDYQALESKLPALFEKYAGPQFPAAFGMDYKEFQNTGADIGLHLQKLKDIHLRSDFSDHLSAPGSIQHIYIFGAVAMFMLLVAIINFMNLSTAGATDRAKEVGVRKVLGSTQGALRSQFLAESLSLTFISLVLSIGLAYVVLPMFNRFSGKMLSVDFLFSWQVWPVILLFGLVVGLMAGSYPAVFLSSFKPSTVLKGKWMRENGRLGLRNGLVVFQFFISIGLIFSTIVVYCQLHFMQHTNLGYDKEQVLVLQTWPLGEKETFFKEQLLQDSRVVNVTSSPYVPAGASYSNNFSVHPDEDPSRLVKTLRYDVDEQYIPTLGMEIVEGRNFSSMYGTDSLSAIINEAARDAFGWTDDVLDKILVGVIGDNKPLRVIGVVKNFHFKSMYERITPLIMVMTPHSGNLIVKTSNGDISGLLRTIEGSYESLSPELPLAYSFLDERINNTYLAERKTAEILGVFAGMTIFVACLGLVGLATFTAYQRTKEIGIRKVLGASVAGIVRLLSTDFIKLVGMAILIALPIAWWVMSKWLEDFAYQIDIEWWMFAVAGLSAIVIALVTVSFQAIKAAVANPVESLRNE